MAHEIHEAPKGFVYKKKNSEREFASIAFIGEGLTIDDYELVSIAEYERIMAEQEEANRPEIT